MIWRTVCLALALSACGPLTNDSPTLSVARNVANIGNVDSAGPSLSDRLNREFLDAQPNELMLVSVISRAATALVVRGGENGSKVTWLSPDGIGLTFEHGGLISTRGLGFDLMSVDVGVGPHEIEAGSNYLRTHEYLNGLDQLETMQFQCSVASEGFKTITIIEIDYQTEVLREDCVSDSVQFRNSYWRSREGVVWQARQWVSEEVGFIGYQRL